MSDLIKFIEDSEPEPEKLHSGRLCMNWEPVFTTKVLRLTDHLKITLTAFVLEAVVEKLQRMTVDEGRSWTEEECIEHFRYQTVDNIVLTTDDIPIEEDGILRLE